METIVTKRKVIDIPEDVFKCLSVKAAAQSTNLKRYIENLLVKDAEEMLASMDDDKAYKWLSENDPEGLGPASTEEQMKFRKWLGI